MLLSFDVWFLMGPVMRILRFSFIIALFSLCLVLLIGCSSKVIYDRYSLTDDIGSIIYTLPYDIKVTLSAPLNEGGVVVKTSSVTLRAANTHRWANDLSTQIAAVLKDALYAHKVNNTSTVLVYVSKFNGSLDGEVYLDLMIEAKGKNKKYLNKSYVRTLKQADKGYSALVATLKTGLFSIASEFANDMVSYKK